MRIVHILDAAKFERKVTTISRLNKYSEMLSLSKLKVREIVKPNSMTALINNKEIHSVSMKIKKGYFTSLHDVYEMKSIPRQLELKTLSDVKDLPSYHFGKAERYTEDLTSKIKKKSPPGSLDHLEKVGVDITAKDLEKSHALKNVCEFLMGKKFRTLAGSVLVFVGSLAGVLVALNEHRKTMQACLVFYYENGSLSSCKLPTCTCIDESMNEFTNKYRICSTNILSQLPDDMTRTTNCKGNVGMKCVNCPSETFTKNIGKDITEGSDNKTKTDRFYIECRNPTIFGAIGDITHGVVEPILTIVEKSVSAVSWFANNLKTIIIIGVCFFAIAIIVWFMKGFFSTSKFSNTDHRHYKELKDKEDS